MAPEDGREAVAGGSESEAAEDAVYFAYNIKVTKDFNNRSSSAIKHWRSVMASTLGNDQLESEPHRQEYLLLTSSTCAGCGFWGGQINGCHVQVARVADASDPALRLREVETTHEKLAYKTKQTAERNVPIGLDGKPEGPGPAYRWYVVPMCNACNKIPGYFELRKGCHLVEVPFECEDWANFKYDSGEPTVWQVPSGNDRFPRCSRDDHNWCKSRELRLHDASESDKNASEADKTLVYRCMGCREMGKKGRSGKKAVKGNEAASEGGQQAKRRDQKAELDWIDLNTGRSQLKATEASTKTKLKLNRFDLNCDSAVLRACLQMSMSICEQLLNNILASMKQVYRIDLAPGCLEIVMHSDEKLKSKEGDEVDEGALRDGLSSDLQNEEKVKATLEEIEGERSEDDEETPLTEDDKQKVLEILRDASSDIEVTVRVAPGGAWGAAAAGAGGAARPGSVTPSANPLPNLLKQRSQGQEALEEAMAAKGEAEAGAAAAAEQAEESRRQAEAKIKEVNEGLHATLKEHQLQPAEKDLDAMRKGLAEGRSLGITTQTAGEVRTLLQVCDGGKALQGVIPTCSQWMRRRSGVLLAVPANVVLTCTPDATEREESFESLEAARVAATWVDTFGKSSSYSMNFSCSIGSMIWGAAFGFSHSQASDEQTTKSRAEQSETNTTTVSHLRTKQVSKYVIHMPGVNEVELSGPAMGELRQIFRCRFPERGHARNVATSQEGHRLLVRFFETYGSHLLLGPFALGGNFHVEGRGVTQREKKLTVAKQEISRAVQSSFSASVSGSYSGAAEAQLVGREKEIGASFKAAKTAAEQEQLSGFAGAAVQGVQGAAGVMSCLGPIATMAAGAATAAASAAHAAVDARAKCNTAVAAAEAEKERGHAALERMQAQISALGVKVSAGVSGTDSVSTGNATENEDVHETSAMHVTTERKWHGGVPTPDVHEWTVSILAGGADERLMVTDRGDSVVAVWEIVKHAYRTLGQPEELSMATEDAEQVLKTLRSFGLREFHRDAENTYYKALDPDGRPRDERPESLRPILEKPASAQGWVYPSGWVFWTRPNYSSGPAASGTSSGGPSRVGATKELVVGVNFQAKQVEEFSDHLKEEFQATFGRECFCQWCEGQFLPTLKMEHERTCKENKRSGLHMFSSQELGWMISGDYELRCYYLSDGMPRIGFCFVRKIKCHGCGQLLPACELYSHTTLECDWRSKSNRDAVDWYLSYETPSENVIIVHGVRYQRFVPCSKKLDAITQSYLKDELKAYRYESRVEEKAKKDLEHANKKDLEYGAEEKAQKDLEYAKKDLEYGLEVLGLRLEDLGKMKTAHVEEISKKLQQVQSSRHKREMEKRSQEGQEAPAPPTALDLYSVAPHILWPKDMWAEKENAAFEDKFLKEGLTPCSVLSGEKHLPNALTLPFETFNKAQEHLQGLRSRFRMVKTSDSRQFDFYSQLQDLAAALLKAEAADVDGPSFADTNVSQIIQTLHDTDVRQAAWLRVEHFAVGSSPLKLATSCASDGHPRLLQYLICCMNGERSADGRVGKPRLQEALDTASVEGECLSLVHRELCRMIAEPGSIAWLKASMTESEWAWWENNRLLLCIWVYRAAQMRGVLRDAALSDEAAGRLLADFKAATSKSIFHLAAEKGTLEGGLGALDVFKWGKAQALQQLRAECEASGTTPFTTPFGAAARYGQLEILQWAQLNEPVLLVKLDGQGRTIFHVAAIYGQLPILQWARQRRMLELLKAQDESGHTIFHLAALRGHPQLLKCACGDKELRKLLLFSADAKGRKVINIIKEHHKDTTSASQVHIRCEGDIGLTASVEEMKQAFFEALWNELMEFRAPDDHEPTEDEELMVAAQMQHDAGVDLDEPGMVPFHDPEQRWVHVAAEKGCLNVMKYLEEQKCDLNARDWVGSTPADLALRSKKHKVYQYLKERSPPEPAKPVEDLQKKVRNVLAEENEWRRCEICWGSGRCQACEGTGKGPILPACSKCRSTGSGKCSTCAGLGKVKCGALPGGGEGER